MSHGRAGRLAGRVRSVIHSLREDLMRAVLGAGVVALVVGLYADDEIKIPVIFFGASLIITGFVGIYMMYTTKEIAQNLYDGMAGISGQIETLSGKMDDMSDKLSGKMDDMSDKLSGKMDDMSDKLSGKMDVQTDILKDIRDALQNPKAA